MADQPKDPKTPQPPDRFAQEKQDLEDIDTRLREARENRDKPSRLAMKIKAPPGNALSLAFRVSVELVSALAVGTGIGWLLDQYFGTRPWLLLVFLLLGGAAGILNVYRMAKGMGYADAYGETGGDSSKQED